MLIILLRFEVLAAALAFSGRADGRGRRRPDAGGTLGVRGRSLALAATLVASATVDAEPWDGRWQLEITGHNSYLFGEPGLGGGLRIPWEVTVSFEVRDGAFLAGSGSARWLDEVTAVSHPPGWFGCRQVSGTYLDSNLVMHSTPRVRFKAFPVAGEARDGRVHLRPGYGLPGNYLAVTYECVTDNPLAYNWFGLAERGKQILGKRQDAEKQADGSRQQARIREVATLPPRAAIDLPLVDGWAFSIGAEDDDDRVGYRLRRLE